MKRLTKWLTRLLNGGKQPSGMVPRRVMRVEMSMRVYRASEGKWYDVPVKECGQ
jgi:hypothetical protein